MVMGGVSQRQVAKALGVSRDTVAVLVRYADSQGWKDLEDLDNVREIDLEPAVLRKKTSAEIGPVLRRRTMKSSTKNWRMNTSH